MTGVYGPEIQPSAPIDIPPEDIHNLSPEDEPPSDDDDNPGAREVFENFNKAEQIEVLKKMAVKKNYEPQKPIDKLNADNRLKVFDALEQMEDVEPESEAEIDDDIPF